MIYNQHETEVKMMEIERYITPKDMMKSFYSFSVKLLISEASPS